MNNDGSNSVEQVTKVVSYVKGGLLAIYYCDNEEKVSEVRRQNSIVVHRSGTVPDGVVNEYYSNSKLHRSAEFKDVYEHGFCTEYYPGGEIFEKSY